MNDIKSFLNSTTQIIKDSYLSIFSVILVLSWFKTTIYYDVFQIDIWSYVDVLEFPETISTTLFLDIIICLIAISFIKIISYLIAIIYNLIMRKDIQHKLNYENHLDFFLGFLWGINLVFAIIFIILFFQYRTYYLILPVLLFIVQIFLLYIKKLKISYFYILTFLLYNLICVFQTSYIGLMDNIKGNGENLPYINNDKKLKLIGMTNNYYFVLDLKNNKTDILNKNSNISISIDYNFSKK